MINTEVVDALAARTRSSRAQVLQSFRDGIRQDLQAVRGALQAGAWHQLAQHAHGLRGACEMLGARAAAEGCRVLEHGAPGGDAAQMHDALHALEREVDALELSLERSMKTDGQDEQAACAGLRFLVVEDHAFQRRMLVQLLQRLGAAQVHEAVDGRAALALLRAQAGGADVIVSDLWMDGMDGLALLRELGSLPHAPAVILASALDADALEAAAREAQACGVRVLGTVDKPVTPAKLLPLLARRGPAAGT